MSKPEDLDETDEIKKRMAREGPKIKKEPDRPGKLMVSGIPKDVNYTNEQLEAEFSAFGNVTEVNIIRKKSTGIPKGFAFVTFKNPADAEEATKQLEGKDIGGESPLHCAQAVIGFIRQSQLASSRGRMMGRGRGGGPWMDRGRGAARGMERGRGMMDRGGFRGMRGGGPPPRGNRGRGGPGGPGGYGAGGEMEGMYYPEEDYYGGGGEYYEEEGYGGGYPERGRGGPRGHPPPRGMMRGGMPARGAPPGMRGRGGQPPGGGRGAYPGRGGAGGGPAMSDRGGGMRRPLLPSPPEMRGGSRGRGGHHPPPPAREEYYGEEEAGYGEEYVGGEEYYEEDPYSNGAGYTEEDPYGAPPDGGYYGVPEAPARPAPAPAPRGRGGAPPATSQRGWGPPPSGGPQGYRGEGAPSRGGPMSRGGAPGQGPSRGAPSGGRGAPAAAGASRRPPAVDAYGYPVEQPSGPARHRPGPPPKPSGYDDYYGEGETGGAPSARDPYARPRAPAGRGQPPAPGGRAGPPVKRGADPYAEDPYSMHGAGDGSQGGPYKEEVYEESYGNPYGGGASAAGRRGAAPTSQGRPPQAVGRPRQAAADPGGYVDISEYVGQGSGGGGSRYQDDYQRQAPSRDMHGEGRRHGYPRRDDPYMDQRVKAETDAYVSYPTSSRMAGEPREGMGRKRPMDGYGPDAGDYHRDYEEYRGVGTPVKRERVDRSVYEAYSSRQEGTYRGL